MKSSRISLIIKIAQVWVIKTKYNNIDTRFDNSMMISCENQIQTLFNLQYVFIQYKFNSTKEKQRAIALQPANIK